MFSERWCLLALLFAGCGRVDYGTWDPDMQPANVGAIEDFVVVWDRAETGLVIDRGTWIFNTDNGRITVLGEDGTTEEAVVRNEGEGDVDGIAALSAATENGAVMAFLLDGLTVARGARVLGYGRRALAILARHDVVIGGNIDVGAFNDRAGPGGFEGGRGADPNGQGPGGGLAGVMRGGGGGGGFGGAGGTGGGGEHAAAGMPYGDVTLEPLIGGSGGGSATESGGRAGHGGGAIQISSRTAIVVETGGGSIDASGSAGRMGAMYNGGGGAGSGGAILLEAPRVDIFGYVGANGGGGGDAHAGGDGMRGRVDVVDARGGGDHGGNGSGDDGIGHNGGDGSGGGGGGAGGGAGRIRVNTTAANEMYMVGVLPSLTSGLATVGILRR